MSGGILGAPPGGASRNDGGAPLPTTIPRLREGLERFAITDVNNPAAGAQAQSEIVVMYDAWAPGGVTAWDVERETSLAQFSFNHIPGGSNVLSMDDRVEFIWLNQDVPMLVSSGTPDELRYWFGYLAHWMGSWG